MIVKYFRATDNHVRGCSYCGHFRNRPYHCKASYHGSKQGGIKRLSMNYGIWISHARSRDTLNDLSKNFPPKLSKCDIKSQKQVICPREIELNPKHSFWGIEI